MRAAIAAFIVLLTSTLASAQDVTAPIVSAFSVTPNSVSVGGAFTIQATVSDAGGTGLSRVELWRAADADGGPGPFSQITFNGVGGNGPATVSFTNAPPSAGTWWYEVRAFDGAGNVGTGGPVGRVVSNAPTDFSKTSPTNGASDQPTNVTLRWQATSGATRYEYCIDQTINGACDGSWTTNGTNTQVTLNLALTTTYTWQVRAVGGTEVTEANGGSWWVFSTAACSFSIAPTVLNVGPAALSGSVTVTTQPGCAWTATSHAGFITVGSGGSGSGSVTFDLAANAGASGRTGTVTIGGQTFTVNQAGTAACTFSINPTLVTIGSAASEGTITVDTQDGCPWSASSSSPFVTFPNGVGRVGPGTVTFAVATNTTTGSRNGTATVAGQSFTVNQSGGPVLRLAPDVNLDGYVDVIWQNRNGGGYIAAWMMEGLTLGDSALFSPDRVTDPNWRVAATADMDGDGRLDLVWQEETQGWIVLWKMNGLSLVSSRAFSVERVPDTDWKIVAAQDFNNDGTADLVWQHRTQGYIAVWLMNGVDLIASELFSPGRVDPKWHIEAAADFNADGKPDLVWRHQDLGWLAIWVMDGLTLTDSRSVSPDRVSDTNWRIAAVGDVNRDNSPDLIWQDIANGWVAVWLMNGTQMTSSIAFSPERVPDTNWRIVGPK